MRESAHVDLQFEMERIGAEKQLWSKGDCIIAAVSGGPDSMALLTALQRLAPAEQLTIIAAHVNHGFRIAESKQELDMVSEYCSKLGVVCETTVLDMPAYIEETGMNGQSASREQRYAFLHSVAEKHGAARIALAHHADDQAETVLMRMIRGTGMAGLAGIPIRRAEKNVELIRPLLRMKKLDIIRYCEEQSIPYCIDSSNNERYYFRNIARLGILPYLSQYNPQLSQSLVRIAEVAEAENEWMDAQSAEWFKQLAVISEGQCSVGCKELTKLPVALQRRLIKLILNYVSAGEDSVSFEGIETIRAAAADQASSTWKLDIGAGMRCIREYDQLRIGVIVTPAEDDYSYSVDESMSSLTVAPTDWTIHFAELPDGQSCKPASRYEACFDQSLLAFPLTVRNRRPGDRIQVLGLNGSKKVQDMFVDEKIPPSEREQYPLLFDREGRLLWIPGIRRSSHALLSEATRSIIHISLRR